MKSAWSTKKLGQLCDISMGFTPARANSKFWGSGYNWLSIADMSQGKDLKCTKESITADAVCDRMHKLIEPGTLLMSFKLSIGKLGFARVPLFTNEAIVALPVRDKKELLPEYLYYALDSIDLVKGTDRAVMGNTLNKAKLEEIEIPLPPLADQRRIAAILDKADAIRRKRQESIRLTEEFLRSTFLEMFGDPVTNPKGWEVVTIRDLVSEVKYGTSDKASYEGKYPILRMNNITYDGGWSFSDLKRIDIPEKELSKYLVHKSDILFNRTNSKELVGKTAVYRRDEPMAFAGYLIRVRPNKHNNSEYIAAYLNSSHGKSTLEGMCKSIVGMANINAQELQDIRILKPPVELQNQYALIVQKIQEKNETLIKSSELTGNLFESLAHRAFRGEL